MHFYKSEDADGNLLFILQSKEPKALSNFIEITQEEYEVLGGIFIPEPDPPPSFEEMNQKISELEDAFDTLTDGLVQT